MPGCVKFSPLAAFTFAIASKKLPKLKPKWRRTRKLSNMAPPISITAWASRRTGTTVQFWAAGRGIKGWQNGLAISGDYMSAASFLGIAGLIAFNGYDGFMYSVGWLVAYLIVEARMPCADIGLYQLRDR